MNRRQTCQGLAIYHDVLVISHVTDDVTIQKETACWVCSECTDKYVDNYGTQVLIGDSVRDLQTGLSTLGPNRTGGMSLLEH